jgi:hypothetical protein
MPGSERVCACGRDAVDVLHLASEDGLLLIPVCGECADDPVAGEQGELFGLPRRRPLSSMSARGDDAQAFLPLEDVEEPGAA